MRCNPKYTLQNHSICANMKSRERSEGQTYMTVKPPLVVSLGRFFHAQRNPQEYVSVTLIMYGSTLPFESSIVADRLSDTSS